MITYKEALMQKTVADPAQKYYPTGLKEFDNQFKGLQIGVNLFAARPGMGLTTLSAQIASNSATQSNAVYISLDKTSLQLANIISQYKGDNLPNLFIEDKIYSAAEILKFLESLTIKCSIIIIDHFKLIDCDISYEVFLKKLMDISKTKQVAVLLQYKLGRSVENRGGDKIPMIQDLNKHPYLKSKCNSIYYLYRPEYYDFTEDENGMPMIGLAYIGDLKDIEDNKVVFKFNTSW